MIAFPSVATAKQALAESERRAAAAQARLAAIDAEVAKLDVSATTADAVSKILDRRRALRRERRGAEIDRDLTVAAKNREERRLKDAEALAACAALDKRCDEVAATIGREYPPAAAAIVALMATRWRLQATLKKAGKQQRAHVPQLREALISSEFCGSLRLFDGLNGYFWYPGDPAQIEEIEAADAVPLGDVRVEAFAGGAEEAERAARAAKAAAAAIVAAYEGHARKIISLFEIEVGVVAELKVMNQRTAGIHPGLTALLTPAQRLTAGRIQVLSEAVFLPAPSGHDAPLWQPSSTWSFRTV
jgi:hypothetical protein